MVKLLFVVLLLGSVLGIEKKIPSNSGRVCGFGDFNNDRYTDIIVQRGKNLTILLYNDDLINVLEDGVFNNGTTFEVGTDTVECTVGDFNGDAKLDILVAQKVKEQHYQHTLWLARNDNQFDKYELDILHSQAMALDVDGDGQHDVLGFYPNGSLYCRKLDTIAPGIQAFTNCSSSFPKFNDIEFTPYPGMPHLYLDLIGDDLYAELIFMGKENDNLKMYIYRRMKDNLWREATNAVIAELEAKYIGAVIPGDFNADRKLELLVPVCQDEACEQVSHLAVWQRDAGWKNITIDLGGFSIVPEKDSKVLFRVGDFTLNGYPDLIVTLAPKGSKAGTSARIVENLPCSHCDANDTRKFEVRKTAFIQPKDVALGVVQMSSFFDLKEDGSLDILVEYVYNNEVKFTFIPSDDKSDTTFLKIQIFTVCLSNDNNCVPSGKHPGTGISWGGSCMYFTMSDGWGGSLQSACCQQPAQTHRSLMAPYVLFGLGRSPNFVDELVVGVPKYEDNLRSSLRMHTQKQIVPNSRIVMMPPSPGYAYWTSRLYVTPSTLILQSLIVISTVCGILLIVVTGLHMRERKEDRVERQQQSHRFHFDAM